MTLFVVIGPPAGGKSTWVNDRASPGDIVIDYDRIARALTALSADAHGHKRPLASVAFRAREAAISEALRHVATHDVYIIHSVPKPAQMEKYRKAGAEVVVVDPGREVTEERCRAERPENYMDGVKRWYASGLKPRPARTQSTEQPTSTAATGRPSSRQW
ncbi:hypothetical protein [Streptomyces sp. NBC_00687]|uniref:hypothetical protein n=1 Tax=Streptomyces sp. NBC_00687 TaxID=2975807 RepID=UPI00225917F1|nr:hypothetical protein [Streptomyces sp. NBC_00687]MCX4912823.1 hypothetical protein [Streptomyces sp. NBC_00687]